MSLKMSEKSREEVTELMRLRYAGRGREGKSRLIDELCALCGYERKYAIKVLGGKRRIAGKVAKKAGSAPRYGGAEREVLKTIWLAAEQPCGKRLKPTMPLWLPHYEAEYGELASHVRTNVLKVSPAAIDRLLKPCRVPAAIYLCTSRCSGCAQSSRQRTRNARTQIRTVCRRLCRDGEKRESGSAGDGEPDPVRREQTQIGGQPCQKSCRTAQILLVPGLPDRSTGKGDVDSQGSDPLQRAGQGNHLA